MMFALLMMQCMYADVFVYVIVKFFSPLLMMFALRNLFLCECCRCRESVFVSAEDVPQGSGCAEQQIQTALMTAQHIVKGTTGQATSLIAGKTLSSLTGFYV